MTARPEDELNMSPEKEMLSIQETQEEDDDWDDEWEDIHKDNEYILTEEQEKNLKEMRQFAKEIDRVPPEKRIPVSDPDKYNFPVGMDKDGNLKLVKEKEDP